MKNERTIADEVLQVAVRYAPEPAAFALATLAEPWTVVVIGRVGAGKTTLLNRWTGEDHPVGLGGITSTPTPRPVADRVWIDTPGIDGLDAAITALAPVVASADGILWVVDGLQPATRTERELLSAVRLPDQPVAALISRLDLVDPEQIPGIAERVGTLLGQASPAGGDLREWSDPPPLAPQPSSPRREVATRHAVQQAIGALDALPALESRAQIAARLAASWRTEVRGCIAELTDSLAAGDLDLDRAVQDRLHLSATASRDQFLDTLAAEPQLHTALATTPLRLPLPEPPEATPMKMVAAAMGGELRSRHRLRDQGAHWLTDGLLALADWIDQAPGLDDPRRAREADRAALAAHLASTPT